MVHSKISSLVEAMSEVCAACDAISAGRSEHGIRQLQAGRFGEAAVSFEKSLSHFPDAPDLRLLLGFTLYCLGLPGRANTHWWAAGQLRRNGISDWLLAEFFTDDHHPERLALVPLCIGRGIDVGCGHRKTHPGAVGVDLIPQGCRGSVGCVEGQISAADVVACGDDLPMFSDNSLDYVVLRHNLEHYQDFIRAIQEWRRIVRPGGFVGMVVPDDEVCDTIHLDPTHKHVFTQSSLARAVKLIGGLSILHVGEVLRNWSFACIARKTDGMIKATDTIYSEMVRRYEREAVTARARAYESLQDPLKAEQCRKYLRAQA